MDFKVRNRGGWSWYYVPELEAAGIGHGFFTSDGPSLPLTAPRRRALLDTVGARDLIIMYQVHGDDVHVIRNGKRPHRGDGLILIERGVAGIVKTADCLPVIIADPGVPMAAVVHAGWRGTAKRITGKAVAAMAAIGARPERMVALLGPAVGPCCYPVGDEVREAFRGAGFSGKEFSDREGRSLLNLKTANREMLSAAGVGAVGDLSLCTCCTGNLFFSYRRGERDVRQFNFASLTP